MDRPARNSRRPTALAAGLLGLAAGCASPGPVASHRATLGTLKASVGQLESEKSTLARQVADLKADNRRLEEELVQAEASNGELARRLDDARGLMRRQASEPGAVPPPRTAPRRTTPAGRPPRKAPFARIPGEVRDLPDDADDDGTLDLPRGDDQARHDGRWLPVARGSSTRLR